MHPCKIIGVVIYDVEKKESRIVYKKCVKKNGCGNGNDEYGDRSGSSGKCNSVNIISSKTITNHNKSITKIINTNKSINNNN